MAWYWWVLIAIAVVIIGYFKLKIFKAIINRSKKTELEEED